jgi:hypothetical protein
MRLIKTNQRTLYRAKVAVCSEIKIRHHIQCGQNVYLFNPLKTKLNPICHLLALLGAHHILHVSKIRVNDESAGA